MNVHEVELEIEKLEIEISDNEYYLRDGRTSNPMKIKRRKRDLNNCILKKEQLTKLLEVFKLGYKEGFEDGCRTAADDISSKI